MRKTVGCFESKTHPSIHPSIFRESVHPSTLPAFSFVRRAKREETRRTFFVSSFRFVQSVLDRSRARETRRGSVRVRHLVRGNFLQSAPTDADVAARTTTRSRNERRRERTQHYFLPLPFLLHPRVVRVRRVAECRAVSPCRPSYTRRLVVSNRRFSRLPRFSRKQTRVEIATRTRDDERTRTFKRNQKGSCAVLFFSVPRLGNPRRIRFVVVVTRADGRTGRCDTDKKTR